MLFSATLDNAIDVLVKRYLDKPVIHQADSAQSPVAKMDHHVLHVDARARIAVLVDLASAPGRTIFFTRTKHGAKALARQLNKSGVPAVDLHGNLSQGARTRNLDAFHSGTATTLVATDIAARGIHVDDVALVVHADPPAEHKAYLHRSGRTARAGAAGTVITLMTDDQVRDVRDLTRAAGVKPTTTKLANVGHPVLQELAPGVRSTPGGIVPAAGTAPSRPRGSGGGGTGSRSRKPSGQRGGSARGRSGGKPAATAAVARSRATARGVATAAQRQRLGGGRRRPQRRLLQRPALALAAGLRRGADDGRLVGGHQAADRERLEPLHDLAEVRGLVLVVERRQLVADDLVELLGHLLAVLLVDGGRGDGDLAREAEVEQPDADRELVAGDEVRRTAAPQHAQRLERRDVLVGQGAAGLAPRAGRGPSRRGGRTARARAWCARARCPREWRRSGCRRRTSRWPPA